VKVYDLENVLLHEFSVLEFRRVHDTARLVAPRIQEVIAENSWVIELFDCTVFNFIELYC